MYLAVCKRISVSKRGKGGLFYFFNQNVEFTSHVPYFNLRTSQPVFRVCIYLNRVEIEKNICTTIYMLSLNFIIQYRKKRQNFFSNAIFFYPIFLQLPWPCLDSKSLLEARYNLDPEPIFAQKCTCKCWVLRQNHLFWNQS